MQRITRYLIAILLPVLLAVSMQPFSTGAVPGVPSGTWGSAGSMTEARAGASPALLTDGRVLITRGRGKEVPLDSTEMYFTR